MSYKTSAFSNETYERSVKNVIYDTPTSTSISFPAVKYKNVTQLEDPSAECQANYILYDMPLPSNINVFSKVKKNITQLKDPSVKQQADYILSNIYLLLQNAYKRRKCLSNRLPQINIVQQEDNSALMEWSFQNFRIGFMLESDKAYSCYFVVSQGENDNLFMPPAQKLDVDTPRSVKEIVEYVLRNT